MKEYLENQNAIGTKYRVIKAYNDILENFCKEISIGNIIKLERGIITPEGKEYYKEYFETTHSELKKELKEVYNVDEPTIMVSRISTDKNEEILLSTEIKKHEYGKKIIYLDEILNNIPINMRHLFYQKMEELKIEERFYRERKRLKTLQQTTNNKIIENM